LSVTGEGDLAEVYSGGAKTRFFDVSQGGGLTLTGLKLSGGSAESGGAVYSKYTNLTLKNCVFDGNTATDGNGGAIWADGGVVTIVGGQFLGNNATRYGGASQASIDDFLSLDGGGGAMFLYANVDITDSDFGWNYALLSGGALHGGLHTNVSVSGCKFGNNTSG
ncbi:unnamed protein product, partial [Laminaria digitata]